MKNLILIATLTLTAGACIAQDDPKSRAVIDQLVNKSNNYKTFSADFVSRLQSKKDGLDVSQNGSIQVKGKNFRLEMDDHTVMSDGATVWTYSSENNEVTINAPEDLDQEMDPTKIFSIYEKDFKSQFVSEETQGGIVMQIIKLFPNAAADKAFHTIMVTVDKAKVEPKQVKMIYKDGNEVSYTLKSFKPDVHLDEGLFTFNKERHPGVEVNDMR